MYNNNRKKINLINNNFREITHNQQPYKVQDILNHKNNQQQKTRTQNTASNFFSISHNKNNFNQNN